MCTVNHETTVWEKSGRVGFDCSCGMSGSTGAIGRQQFEYLIRRSHEVTRNWNLAP